ncbi:unnamed protein product [Caenorhabditis angaria]|uniref:Zinc transporter ZIP9 n=1 Tax=Caenorhabditis angaria TaxID=860376 RepID=A0A9P1IWI5_9PELO|nr:unnamed protein product [Caenorhabditis angaria]
MEGVSFLFILSSAMFFGSYIAGSIPLMFSLSESKIRLISIFGAGLLVGTALSVIVPEGVEALYSAQSEAASHHIHNHNHHEHDHREVVPAAIQNPAEAKNILESENKVEGENAPPPRIIPKDAVLNEGIQRVVRSSGNDSVETKKFKREIETHSVNENEADSEHGHSHSHGNVHGQIGYSLVLGFVLMLLVDQIGSAAVARNDRSGRSRIGLSATIGLVVHAAADGVALGSASVINKSDVQLIVFVAIMLHKAPAAFGLVSFLLMEGIDRRTIRKHLIVFSAAAPIAALITFLIIMHMGESVRSESSTGVLMLFSAGTFLYVATVHVLPELANNKQSDYSLVVDATAPSSIGHSHSGGASFSAKELVLIISGAIVPAILASGHSH